MSSLESNIGIQSGRRFLRTLATTAVVLTAVALTGCSSGNKQLKDTPRIRPGCYASATLGTKFANPENLGEYSYHGNRNESGGILYTKRGGHIDKAHLGKAADWIAYFAALTKLNLSKEEKGFSFKCVEPSRYEVKIAYPRNWNLLPASTRKKVTNDLSVKLGQYLSSTMMTWHEMLTWEGYRSFKLYPEKASAFSWEDAFSNNLGVHLAGIAIRDGKPNYDKAMTRAFNMEMEKLELMKGDTAKVASRKVAGKWYGEGGFLFLVEMKKRNFDIGESGYITPWLVREIGPAAPISYPVPKPSILRAYGFDINLTISPRTAAGRKMGRVVGSETIQPEAHFPIIMQHIRQEAVAKYGQDVDKPYEETEVAQK